MIWLIASCCIVAAGCAYISWRAPNWPQGDTVVRQQKQYTVRVVFSDEVKIEEPEKSLLVDRAAKAVYAAGFGWAIARATVSGWNYHRKHKTICILFRGKAHFEAKAEKRNMGELYAYLIKVPHGAHYVPLLVINETQISKVIRTGEPVIHEMMHTLSNTYITSDTIHDDPTIWAVSERWFKESAQTHGRLTFREMLRRSPNEDDRTTEEGKRINH